MSGPYELATAHVERSQRGRVAADNREIFVDRGRGCQPRADIDRPAGAEIRARLASRGIQGDQSTVQRSVQQAPLRAVLPKAHPAIRPEVVTLVQVDARIERPALRPRLGVETEHAVVRRRDVQRPVRHQRRAFVSGTRRVDRAIAYLAAMMRPSRLQFGDVVAVDLSQRTESVAAGVATPLPPLALGVDLARTAVRECAGGYRCAEPAVEGAAAERLVHGFHRGAVPSVVQARPAVP